MNNVLEKVSNNYIDITSIWLTNTFGGRIYMIPRINYPKNIQTPDYIYNNEAWDLKEIFGSSNQVI